MWENGKRAWRTDEFEEQIRPQWRQGRLEGLEGVSESEQLTFKIYVDNVWGVAMDVGVWKDQSLCSEEI